MFADLEIDNLEEELLKAQLTSAIARKTEQRKFKNQSEAAKIMGVD